MIYPLQGGYLITEIDWIVVLLGACTRTYWEVQTRVDKQEP